MPADPKKPGKPCARCNKTWREHHERAEGACRKWYARWWWGKRKHVPTGIERVMDLNDQGEK